MKDVYSEGKVTDSSNEENQNNEKIDNNIIFKSFTNKTQTLIRNSNNQVDNEI